MTQELLGLLVSAALSVSSLASTVDMTDRTVTLVMVGDMLLHTPVVEAATDDEGNYDFHYLFRDLGEQIQEADIAMVNQEVVLGGSEIGVSDYPCFNAPQEVGDALYDAGFDVVCHATNHALDKGSRGLRNTIDYWESAHPDMVIAGIHGSAEDQQEITTIESHGVTFAILNYTYGTNGIAIPSDMPYGVDLLEEDRVAADLERAEELADVTIVCPHWGVEYQLEQSASQERWADFFIEHGADLVIGTHPHVIQPVEERDGVPVYYSLGNYVNWTHQEGPGICHRMIGGMARVTFYIEEDGTVSVDHYDIEAIVDHLEEGPEAIHVYPLHAYTPELANRNEVRKQDDLFSYDYCFDVCNRVWGHKWE